MKNDRHWRRRPPDSERAGRADRNDEEERRRKKARCFFSRGGLLHERREASLLLCFCWHHVADQTADMPPDLMQRWRLFLDATDGLNQERPRATEILAGDQANDDGEATAAAAAAVTVTRLLKAPLLVRAAFGGPLSCPEGRGQGPDACCLGLFRCRAAGGRRREEGAPNLSRSRAPLDPSAPRFICVCVRGKAGGRP